MDFWVYNPTPAKFHSLISDNFCFNTTYSNTPRQLLHFTVRNRDKKFSQVNLGYKTHKWTQIQLYYIRYRAILPNMGISNIVLQLVLR